MAEPALTQEQDIRGRAVNALTRALREDQWMPLSDRERIADAILEAVDTYIRANEAQRLITTSLGMAELQRRVDDLRAFEREYRSRLRAYHQGRIDELDAEREIPDD